MLSNQKTLSRRCITGVFLLLLALAVVYMLPRVRLGTNMYDESFYFTVPHRLMKGDALLSEEWHLSQLSGLLLLPFVKGWLAGHTSEGMVLAFRYLYLAVKALLCVGLYGLLCRRGPWQALLAALLMFLYTPMDLYQLSYQSMGPLLVGLHGAFLVHGWERLPRWELTVSGVFLAMAVLCCPFLVGAWVCEWLAALLARKRERRYLRAMLWLTLGCALSAAAVLGFVLSRASVGEILRNLPEMLRDPEHTSGILRSGYYTVTEGLRYFWYLVIWFAGLLVWWLAGRKKRTEAQKAVFRTRYGLLTALGGAVSLLEHTLRIQKSFDFVMIPLAMAGLMWALWLFAEGESRREDVPLAVLWAVGILYGLAIALSSNQDLHVFGNACTVSAMAAVYFAGRFFLPGKKKYRLLLIALAVLQVGCLLWRAENHIFGYRYTRPDTVVERGPLKGIVLTADETALYNDILTDLDTIRALPEGNFAVFCNHPWAYLYVDMPYGTYSGWSGEEKSVKALGERYYTLHPDKIPDYIYITDDTLADEAAVLRSAEAAGYTVIDGLRGYVLIKNTD